MLGLELIEPFRDPHYYFIALWAFLTLRVAWTMWRQYQRIRHW